MPSSVPACGLPVGGRPRVLCVDDEPRVLEGLRDTLRRHFDVRVAEGGADGLALLRANPRGFVLVISDMRMPLMPGSVFLREARRVAPLAVRLLLTGHSDVDAAIAAVNDGQISQFLTKPCEPEELLRACAGALWQHRLLAAERVLVKEMLDGSVQALMDVLLCVSPGAFARGSRVKRMLARLTADIGIDDAWELEAAAMLSQLGAITLPAATSEKLYSDRPLSAQEAAAVERASIAGRRIVARIPQLEGVLQILTSCGRRFDSIDRDGMLPVGARALRIALDYDALESSGESASRALEALRERDGVYDPELLDTFARGLGVRDALCSADTLGRAS